MATPSDENWADIEPGEIQDLIEPFQQGDDDLLFDKYVNYPPDAGPLYPLWPSTADGLDDSTSFVSGPEPGLTQGGSTLPSSHHPQTCLSLDRPFEDPGFSHHVTHPTQRQLKESCDNLSAPQVDLQFIGEGPEIHDQGSVSFPPVHLQDDDLPTILLPSTYGYGMPLPGMPLPGMSTANVSATGPPFVSKASSGGLSRAHVSSLDMHSAIGSSLSVAGASSQPMARGRSNPLPEEKRAKAAVMRNTKACMRCRIRHVECDEGQPCVQCDKNFPNYPEICDRARLVEILPGENQPGLWLQDSDRNVTSGDRDQPHGDPVQVIMIFDEVPDRRSPHLSLSLQPYYTNSAQDGPAQVDHSYYFPPPVATFGTVPMSTSGNWPGTPPYSYYLPNGRLQYFLAPRTHPPPMDLLRCAETQVSRDQEQTRATEASFEAAVQIFVFALRDRPLPLPPEKLTTGAGPAGGRRRSRSSAAPLSAARYLLRNVCELVCWARLWRAPVTYYVQQGRGGTSAPASSLPTTVLRELKEIALPELVSCERRVMEELDELLVMGIRGIEVPVLACLWQTILIYRQLIRAYSQELRGPPGFGAGGVTRFGAGQQQISTVTRLYRLLLIKYAAYFGSSSPIFPRARQLSTSNQLAGDEHLQRAWNHVLVCREGFYRELAASIDVSDVLLKTLVVDVEEDLERRRRRGRRER